MCPIRRVPEAGPIASTRRVLRRAEPVGLQQALLEDTALLDIVPLSAGYAFREDVDGPRCRDASG